MKVFRVLTAIILLTGFCTLQAQTNQRKVLIHYMGWFGEGETGTHWSCGQAHTPMIGYYSSLSWAAQMYHILLSWSCGIDGLVINVKDGPDADCMKLIVQTLKRLYEIDHAHFSYDFSISYDDQGLLSVYEAEEKFIYLRDFILTEPIDFLSYDGTPAIFAFNYPNAYLTAEEFFSALDDVFDSGRPYIVWNQIEADAAPYVNSFFPWVQPGGEWNGVNWGKVYLDWFYPEFDYYTSQLDFATGGVWAGFDDRSNGCWGDRTRWIDRQDGWVYDETWKYVNEYSGDLPLDWVVIETWNDWNEGTEIEPSIEYGYKFLKSTINNINTFKSISISSDTAKFETLKSIYYSADSIERGLIDSVTYYPILKSAIADFIMDNPVACNTFQQQHTNLPVNIYPNPANKEIHIESEYGFNTLSIFNCDGRKLVSEKYLKPVTTVHMQINLEPGIYSIRLDNKQMTGTKMIVVD